MIQPMTWSEEERRHMIDRPRFGLEDPEYRRLVAEAWLNLRPGMLLADVGCGSAASSLTLLPFVAPNGSLTGFDRDPAVLPFARQNAERDACGTPARFVLVETDHIPATDGAFDVTLCQTVLMHAASPDALLSEMQRITRPGGLVAATEPDWSTMRIRNLARPPRDPEDDGLWARTMARIIEGGRRRGSGDWSIGSALVPLFRARGLTSVRSRVAPASWMVAPSTTGNRSDGALHWALNLFYPLPDTELNASERESHGAADGTPAEWRKFEALREKEREQIMEDHEQNHAYLHVHTAAYLATGRVPPDAI